MQTIRLEPPLAPAILKLTLDRLELPAPSLASVTDGEWQGFRFRGHASELEIDGGSLRLRCFAREGTFPLDALDRLASALNTPSWFDLTDGSRLNAKLTHLVQWGGIRCSLGIRPGAVIDLDHWEWNPSARPSLWVGRLAGAECRRLGNLSVRERDGSAYNGWHDHARLEGQCAWHVVMVEGQDVPIVVLEPLCDGNLRDAITHDFMAAQFAFGRPLALDMLVGTDADLNPISALGLRLGTRGLRGRRSPVPERFDDPTPWQALLFECLARKLKDEGANVLKVPIGAYLDGVSSHLDLAYLAGQVGLEAFAFKIVGKAAPHALVKDTSAWSKWVNANKGAISDHALDADAGRKLLGKVVNAHQAPSSDRVEAALRHYALDVPDEVVEEIMQRSQAVHEYLMSGREPVRDLLKDVDRRDTVLTLLAALVAKYVGFDGPIVGWERADGGGREVPPWWPHRGEGARRVRFVCERER
jgi:hypothetical protein